MPPGLMVKDLFVMAVYVGKRRRMRNNIIFIWLYVCLRTSSIDYNIIAFVAIKIGGLHCRD